MPLQVPCPAPEPYRRSAALSMLHRATTQRLGCGRPATPRTGRLIIVTEVRRPAAGIQHREAWNTMRKPGCAAADAVQTAGQWDGEAIRIPRTREGLNGASVEPGTGAEGISGAANCLSLHRSRKKGTAPRSNQEGRVTDHSRSPPDDILYGTEVRGVYGLREATALQLLSTYGQVPEGRSVLPQDVHDGVRRRTTLHNSSGVSLNLGSETRPCLAYM
jgi:hypothetical protein